MFKGLQNFCNPVKDLFYRTAPVAVLMNVIYFLCTWNLIQKGRGSRTWDVCSALTWNRTSLSLFILKLSRSLNTPVRIMFTWKSHWGLFRCHRQITVCAHVLALLCPPPLSPSMQSMIKAFWFGNYWIKLQFALKPEILARLFPTVNCYSAV